MSQGPRVVYPDRSQTRLEVVCLVTQLPPGHLAHVVWSMVTALDLSEFYAQTKARDDVASRPASDPAVLLALWLYATLEGIGAARMLDRLCDYHAAYRWLCGGVPVNHNLLSEFRRESGAMLDRLLTQSLTSLIAEGLVKPAEVSIDGTKVRARAGRNSLAQGKKLAKLEAAVAQRVADLKSELDDTPEVADRRRQGRALRAAQEHESRPKRARLAEFDQEKAERAKRHAKEEAEKSAPSVSASDPEARSMRLPDGSAHLAWNVQVATANGFIVAIEPTDRSPGQAPGGRLQDSGLAIEAVEQIERRCGATPERLLADATAITQGEIDQLSQRSPKLVVYSPPPKERETVTTETLRKRRWKHRHEPDAVKQWRERMASVAGKEVYRQRKFIEHAHAHAKMKNHGFGRMLVHGIAKVRVVCLLHALAHNLRQALWLRAAAA